MTRTLRSRSLLAAAALAAAAIPAVTTASPAPTTTATGPSHPKVGEEFSVGAKGQTNKQRILQVTIHLHGKCSSTYYGEEKAKSILVFVRAVGPGRYNASRGGWVAHRKTNGNFCAYLGDPNKKISEPPRARDSKHFQVVASSAARAKPAASQGPAITRR
jgi:hypothetical protein